MMKLESFEAWTARMDFLVFEMLQILYLFSSSTNAICCPGGAQSAVSIHSYCPVSYESYYDEPKHNLRTVANDAFGRLILNIPNI